MKKTLLKQSVLCGLILGCTATASSPTLAAGFATRGESLPLVGSAFAGAATLSSDASSAHYNPATLTLLNKSQVTIGSVLVHGNAEPETFSGSTALSSAIGGAQDTDNAAQAGLTGALHALYSYNNDLKLALSITTPWGIQTSYEENWIGRYHGVTSELLSTTITPTIAYKVNDKLSLAGGIQAQYTKARLTNAVDCGTIDSSNGGALGLTPGTTTSDCFSDMDADAWGYGFTLGVLYEFNDKTRFGLGYRSEIEHELKGSVRYDLVTPLLATTLPNGGVSTDLTTPAILTAGLSHQVMPKLRLALDVQWTEWSSLDRLNVAFDSGQANDITDYDWNNAVMISLGGWYSYSDTLTLRAGLAHDESPVYEALRGVRIPDSSRSMIAVGATYKPLEALSVDFGYYYSLFDDAPVTLSATGNNAARGSLTGNYDTDMHVFGLQAGWAL